MLWPYVLTVVGIAGFWLAGKKVWWAWYINIANQGLWTTYALLTEQWGFLIGVGFYMIVFIKNAISWTKERFPSYYPSNSLVEEDTKESLRKEADALEAKVKRIQADLHEEVSDLRARVHRLKEDIILNHIAERLKEVDPNDSGATSTSGESSPGTG